MAFDFKKEFKEFYLPKNKPEIVDVPEAKYIAVRGEGNPNDEGGAYQQAVGILYSVAYTLKMSYKSDYKIEGFFEYVVPPLEGFWWQDGVAGVDYANKSKFHWISIIRLPDFVTKENFDWAVQTASVKKKMDCSKAEYLTVKEGLCVQMMHIGPFDDEPASVAMMNAYIEEQGYENDITDERLHHEIYMSDARKVAPEKWKTVIRHPIKKKYEGNCKRVMKKNSKKICPILLSVAFAFLLCSCNSEHKEENFATEGITNSTEDVIEQVNNTEISEVPYEEDVSEEENSENDLAYKKSSHGYCMAEYPVIDGATALAPFYEAMTACLLDLEPQQARGMVMCSTTAGAYENLINKTADMIFCSLPSEEQLASATENNVEFETYAIFNGGFVFFVNKENPVNSITVEQLKGIYTGQITNWKELGGNDEEIIAYQRTEGSGSQTGLYRFIVSKDEVMEAPQDRIAGEMDDAIDVVANYENSTGAIGFSFYYYIVNMHYSDQIKMLAVEGIEPNNDTIGNKTYPLVNQSQIVIRKDTSQDSIVRDIITWVKSEEGIEVAKENGYVPSKEEVVYSDTGVISKSPVTERFEKGIVRENSCELVAVNYDTNQKYHKIIGLKDMEVKKKINKRIYSVFCQMETQSYIPSYQGLYLRMGGQSNENDKVLIRSQVEYSKNNIVSIRMNATCYRDGNCLYEYEVPLNFNLETGEELKLEQLFYEGEDYIDMINDRVDAFLWKNSSVDEEWEIGANGDYEMSKIRLCAPFESIQPNQKFYICGDNKLVLIMDYDTPEFYLENCPYHMELDIDLFALSGISDEDIFESNEYNYGLSERIDCSKTVEDEDIKRYVDEQRKNATICVRYWNYQNLPEKAKQKIKQILDAEEWRPEFENNYDRIEKEIKASEWYYYVDVLPNVRSYGDYLTLELRIIDYVPMKDQEGSDVTYYNKHINQYICFNRFTWEEVTLQELFVKGADYESIMSQAMLDTITNVDDSVSLGKAKLFVQYEMEHISGVSVKSDGLQLCFDVSDEEMNKKKNLYLNNDEIKCEYIAYRDIGYEHLMFFAQE